MIIARKEAIYLLTIVFIAIGCKMDDEGLQQSITKKCYLLKSTTTHSINDFIDEESYVLNSEGRAIGLTKTLKNASSDVSYNESYYYAQNGKISKVEGSTYYTTYNYNTSNQLINASYYLNNMITTIIEYQYNVTGQLVKKIYSEKQSDVLVYSGYREYAYLNSTSRNASKESFYNTGSILQFYVEYEYDENPNPLSTIGLEQLLTVPTVNNITKSIYTQIAGAPSINVTINTYQYNDIGYPSQMLKSSSFDETIIFLYDCK